MKLIEFTGATGKISIVLKHIQAITEGSGNRKGKANIVVARLDDNIDDFFKVEETYREALMMVNNVDL